MSRSRKSKRRDSDGPPAAPTEPITSDDAPAITTRDLAPAAENSLESEAWPQRANPAAAGERGAGFAVVVRRSVLNEIHRHGQASSDVEVCGVLVGNVYRDEAGPWLLIDACIRGENAGQANSQVTFTAETWAHVQGVMEREHTEQRIVGWYHTHPGFGIFLSDMDLFIHGNFFNMAWQVAFVYDPHSQEEGAFVWRDGKIERGAYAVEEDVEKEVVRVTASPEVTAAALADFSRRLQGIERRQRRMAVALPFVVMVAVGWPFVLYTVMAERGRTGRHVGNEQAEKATTAPTTMPAEFRNLLTPRDLKSGVFIAPAVQPTRSEWEVSATTEAAKPQATTGAVPATLAATTAPASAPATTTSTSGPKVLESPAPGPGKDRE